MALLTKIKLVIIEYRGKSFWVFLYLLLIFLSSFGLTWWIKPIFWIFGIFLVWVVGFGAMDYSMDYSQEESRPNFLWFIFPLGVLFFTRIIPYIHWGSTPLGYDTGIYLKNFRDSFFSLQNFKYLQVDIFISILRLFGWQAEYLVSYFYIALSILVGLSVYILVKEYFGRCIGYIAFFLYSLSVSQFLAYWGYYWTMILAMSLTLMSFYLLKRKSWLVLPVAVFLGAVHQPTFLVFGATMLLYFLFGRERKFTFWAGLGIMVMVFILSYQIYWGYFMNYFHTYGLITDLPEYLAYELTGQFVSFDIYRKFVMLYLPFSLLGFVWFLRKREFHYPLFYFVINFIFGYFHFILYQRFIILFDLAAIMLAAPVLSEFLKRFAVIKIEKLAAGILLLGAGWNIFYYSWGIRPLIYKDELEEIKTLKHIEDNAYVMTVSSYYAPWVYGFSERNTIAPGLFSHNKWDYNDWKRFWFTGDRKERYALLNEYQRPLYIFIGDKDAFDVFRGDPAFVQQSKRIWKYVGKFYEN